MGERRDGRKGEGTIASPTVRPKYMLEHLMIFFFYIHYMYRLLTKREVKMAGYWPSSFFAC